MTYSVGVTAFRLESTEMNERMEVLMKDVLRRGLVGLAATMVATLAMAGSASAGVLVQTATDCAPQAMSTPFAPWHDSASYTPMPSGGLEAGAPGWRFTGGAKVVSGNEPWKVAGANDSMSLRLPAGSSAVTPPLCVGLEHPTVRFFAKKNSGLLSTLAVTAVVHLQLGPTIEVPFGVLLANNQWKPSPAYLYLGNLLPLVPGQVTDISFRFVPLLGGDWQVDDVYVDPLRAR
jgi:hypothetical protein